MRLLRRNQYLLCFLGALVLASVMVVRQFIANQSAHIELREDFILLHDRAETKACAGLYATLIEQLPRLSDRSLVDDLERTSMLVDPKTPDQDNLVWKYHLSVKRELEQRAENRLRHAVERAEKR
jgi:hypothetical protein